MKHSILIIISLIFLNSCLEGLISPSDLIEDIPVVDIVISNDEYLTLLSNKLVNVDVPCRIHFDSDRLTGYIRSVGAGSRYQDKWSFRLTIKDGEFLGHDQFNLSAQVTDESMLVGNIAAKMYSLSGFPVPDQKHVFVRINGKDRGLYLLIERVNEEFFRKRDITPGELFKVGFDSKFSFRNDHLPHNTIEKKLPDDNNYNNLVGLFNAIDTSSVNTIYRSLGEFLDINNYIIYHALTSLLNNEDAFTNNFFFHKPEFDVPFRIIPWDFDRCFDRNPENNLSGKNDIIEKLLLSDTTRVEYISVVKEMLAESFAEERIFPIIDSVANVIRESYNLDPYLGNGRLNFDDEINRVKEHIRTRRAYFIANIDSLK